MILFVVRLYALLNAYLCYNVQGAESDELAAASKLEDDVNFYQTVVADVAKLFHIDPSVKRPALILLKKEEEKLNHFGLFLILLPPFPLKKRDNYYGQLRNCIAM